MSGPEHAAREQQVAPPVQASPVLRRRLAVGAVDDPMEREAEETAERIVASLDAVRRSPTTGTTRIRRAATGAAPIGADGGSLDAGTESMLNSQIGRGRSLDEGTRATLEPHFGADFSGVRVHDDAPSQELNRRMSAQAFTIGSDIFFSGSAPDASSAGGQGLLAHELTHVVQQGGAAAQRRVDPAAVAPSKVRRRDDSR